VGILGSGAAGLTAAYYLAKKGYRVAVMEGSSYTGGTLRGAKGLPSEELDADIADIAALGVQIQTAAEAIPVDKLKEQGFESIFIAAKPTDASILAGINLGRGNVIQVNAGDLSTSQKGVFAGGEAINEKASFIKAVADGRKAAKFIDLYMGGNGEIDEVLATPEAQVPRVGPRPDFAKQQRKEEDPEKGFTEDEAIFEAKRCMNCDLRLRVACLVKQPHVAVKRRPAGLSV